MAPAGVDVKLKLADVVAVEAGGVDVIVVSGRTRAAIVQANVAGVASVPPAFTARTLNVWLPIARPVSERGLVQVAYAAPSSEHWNVAPAAGLAVNVNSALVLVVDAAGVEVSVVSGGVVVMSHVSDAGVGSVPSLLDRAHLEGVRADREAGQRTRAGAGRDTPRRRASTGTSRPSPGRR